MSAPLPERGGSAELVAGFLAAASIAASAIAVVWYPVRIAPVAVVLALVAAGMARGQHRRLAAFAVLASAFGWLIGMTIAIATERPLW